MPSDFDLIIFDQDGTLYPVAPEMDAIYPTVALELAAKSVRRQPSEIKAEFEAKRSELANQINGIPTSTLNLMYHYDADMQAFEREITQRIQLEKFVCPDPKTMLTISAIAQHYALFLFTTNNGQTTEKILNYLQLAAYFPPARRLTFSNINNLPISKSAKIEYLKPFPKGYQFILEKCNAHPHRTLMVGDSLFFDIIPAQKLGLATYQITSRTDLYALPEYLEIDF